MFIPVAPHPWDLTPAEAMALQKEMAREVALLPLAKGLRFVAGLDVAFERSGRGCASAAVLWDVSTRCTLERHHFVCECPFPYVPGLLSFREGPALLGVLALLRQTPDVLLFGGHGLAHPRRFGLACHMGVIAGLPSIGCARNLLCGRFEEPPARQGACTPVRHMEEVIGAAVRTRRGTRCVFVSPGHLIDLEGAVDAVLASCAGFRLPEPLRLARRAARAVSRRL